MKRKTHPTRKPRPASSEVEPAGGGYPGEILERPDGFCWKAPDSPAEFGPFDSCELARADRDAQVDEPPEDAEALREAEREIGINDWMDVETGEPAEGESPPHLDEE